MAEALQKDGIEVSLRGGAITSWRHQGKDIFFRQQELVIDGETKVRGGLFATFPNHGAVDEKFRLPQHGPLRGLKGRSWRDPVRGVTNVRFEGREAFGKKVNRQGAVTVSVDACSGGNSPLSITYSLNAALYPQGNTRIPVNSGFHPYFSTPFGRAIVRAGTETYSVDDILVPARAIPFSPDISIEIPGIGEIEMKPGGRFLTSPLSYLLLWRDDERYLCVEPVLAPSRSYGAPECPELSVGHPITISCFFRWRP